jgi:hypothetical protein
MTDGLCDGSKVKSRAENAALLGPKSNVVQTGKIKTVYFSVRRQKETPENAPTQKYETPNIHPLPDAQSRNDADRWAINPCFTSSPDNHH